jgi:thiamine-monophosphate kinase
MGIVVPPGDDLAALRWPADELLLVGVDQVLDQVHFDSAIHTPRQIGRKVMNRNLSDCAAMACLPAAAVTTAALPKGVGLDYAKELYLGLRDAADPFDCPIVGGDTASWNGRLLLTVSILGRSAGIDPITRSGAKVGDSIYVTGPLGGSILGRHMTFEPRVNLARDLAATGAIHAMIDISDGLSRDLGHICRLSKVGATINAAAIPVHEDARRINDGRSPLDHALDDGEDHELLLAGRLKSLPPGVVRIGQIVAGSEITITDESGTRPLVARGWQHTL